jgi:hypothetical protein
MLSRLYIVLTLVSALVAGEISTVEELETFTHEENGLHLLTAQTDQGPYTVTPIGDFDGDGNEDFAIGYPSMSANGIAFVVLGRGSSGFDPSTFVSGDEGLKIVGAHESDQFGAAVGAAGDVNGDGFADCLIGAPGVGISAKHNVGAVYMIFGKAGPYADIHMSNFATGIHGFAIIGEASNTRLGFSHTSLRGALGDVNGDGVDDFAIASSNADFADRTAAGMVYIIYGKPAAEAVANIDLALELGDAGVKIGGAANGDMIGTSITGAGDVNGDGIRDLLIGCAGCSAEGREGAGAAYVVYGAEDMADMDLAEFASGQDGKKILGAATAHMLGATVSNAADLNGDGLADLVLGAPGAHTDLGHDVGCVHVIYGTDAEDIEDIDLADFEAGPETGYTICGEAAGVKLGSAVAHAGDVNQDGIDDMLLSTADHDGSVYVLYGDSSRAEADIDLTEEGDSCYVLSSADVQEDAGSSLTADTMMDTYNADPASLLGGAVHVKAGAVYSLACGSSPTRSPTRKPTNKPTRQPTRKPTARPVTRAPTRKPTARPVTRVPTKRPTNRPTHKPSLRPTRFPTKKPTTRAPTRRPTHKPTHKPTRRPTHKPTRHPTRKPTRRPTSRNFLEAYEEHEEVCRIEQVRNFIKEASCIPKFSAYCRACDRRWLTSCREATWKTTHTWSWWCSTPWPPAPRRTCAPPW